MGKIIFWIVVVFVVLFALRMINVAKRRARDAQAASRRAPRPQAADGPVRANAACSCRRRTRGRSAAVRCCGDAACRERATHAR